MKRILFIFFSLVLVFTPALVFASVGGDTVLICHYSEEHPNGETMRVPEADWPDLEGQGDTLGACEVSPSLIPGGGDEPENLPPYFVEFDPPLEIHACEPYLYRAEADDPEGDTLLFTLEGPELMIIDEAEGSITWIPREDDAGNLFEVLVGVDDGENSVSELFSLSVLEGGEYCESDDPAVDLANSPPEIAGPHYVSTTVGTLTEFNIVITDEDGDDLAIGFNLPDGAAFDELSGVFSWMPIEIGTTTASWSVSDGSATTTHETLIEVFEAEGDDELENLPPYFVDFNPPTEAIIGLPYSYDVQAEDPEGDILTFSFLNNPLGMTIDGSSGLIDWTPSGGIRVSVSVEVSDGVNSASTTYAILLSSNEDGGDGGGGGPGGGDPVTPVCGDVDGSGEINMDDVTAIINYIFADGELADLDIADVDGSGEVNISDAIYLIQYLNVGGPAPVCSGGDGEDNPIEVPYIACSDVNQDGQLNDDDVTAIINYIFADGELADLDIADVDGSGEVNISDAIYLIQYLHAEGPPPTCAFEGGDEVPFIACSDVNQDGLLNNGDADAIINYIFADGELPNLDLADIDGDGVINISDVVYLIQYLHAGGPAPVCVGNGDDGGDDNGDGGDGGDGNPEVILSGGGGSDGIGGGGYVNLPPEFVNFNPPTQVIAGDFYSYDVEAMDPEGGIITFSLLDAPDGMAIIPETGIIYWYPSYDQAGESYSVTVMVSDGANSVSETYSVSVDFAPVPPPASPVGGGAESGPEFELPPIELNVPVDQTSGSDETSSPISGISDEDVNNGGLLANLLANLSKAISWLGDKLLIPILVLIAILLIYLVYLVWIAFAKRKKEDEDIPGLPASTDSSD